MATYAGIGSRIVAIIIDHIILFIIAVIVSLPFGATAFMLGAMSNPMAAAGALAAIAAVVVINIIIWILYFTYFEGKTGQTPGKSLVNIKVVKEGKKKMTYGDALVRTILRIIDGLFFYILGLIIIAATEKRQRLGDIVAKTLVVKA